MSPLFLHIQGVSITYRVGRWLWDGLDWLFPPVCAGCGRKGFRWCPDCQANIRLVPEPACRTCGLPLAAPGLCRNCKLTRPHTDGARSWAIYEGPIRNALHSLKYRRNMALGSTLAPYLVEFVRQLAWDVELVVPVPAGRKRLQERGYNQVELLARPLSALQNWHYSPHMLKRIRDTRSQVGLAPAERKANVSGAFEADPALASGRLILLVDDIATTGATLSACSEALFSAGARKVYALTLARALPQHGFLIV